MQLHFEITATAALGINISKTFRFINQSPLLLLSLFMQLNLSPLQKRAY